MTQNEFRAGMQVILDTFGAAEYPPARMLAIYELVSDLSDFELRSIAKHFVETKPVKWPPLPTHFREAAQDTRKMRTDRHIERLASHAGYGDGQSLNRVLDQMGAKSLLDAVYKSAGNSDTARVKKADPIKGDGDGT